MSRPGEAERGEGPEEAYLEPYRAAVERHGGGFEATLWGSPRTQVLRFDVAIGLAEFPESRILDVGCGPGALAERLIERKVPFRGYHGIDALPEMIATARARIDDPRCRFATADPLADPDCLLAADADWAVLSGTLNTMEDATAWRLLEACWRSVRRGVVVNVLSDRCPPERRALPTGPARRMDVLAWLDRALDLTPCVAFRQDYLDGHDATILLRRRDPAG